MKVQTELRIMIKALLLSYLVTGAALLLVAFLLFQMEPEESMVLAGIQVIYVLGSFVCGFVAGKGIRKKRMIWGMAAGIGYYLFLLLASICSGGIQSAPEQILMTFALCLGGGMLGGILS